MTFTYEFAGDDDLTEDPEDDGFELDDEEDEMDDEEDDSDDSEEDFV